MTSTTIKALKEVIADLSKLFVTASATNNPIYHTDIQSVMERLRAIAISAESGEDQ